MATVQYTRFAAHCLSIYESPRYSRRTHRKMEQLLGVLAQVGIRTTAVDRVDYVAWAAAPGGSRFRITD